MIDLHCHVLPGVDDGPETLDGSIALGRAARAAGITTLVATPPVSREYRTTAQEAEAGVAAVHGAAGTAGVEVAVVRGAEVALPWGAELPEGELASLTLGAGDWLLVECPLSPGAGEFDLLLHALRARGHRIVLAHPERSPSLQRDLDRVGGLVDAGMLCSITAASLVGGFGRTARHVALRLVEADLVHNVTSDAHDVVRRPPGLREAVLAAAVEAPRLAGRLRWLTDEVPRAILAGEDAPPPPAGTPNRRRRWSWRR